ncbi:MAG: hypothetical protein K6G11_06925 [Lachnospiraceae bacterium]|nr:hypothetical protein [Lachnospiraceae bacterium]
MRLKKIGKILLVAGMCITLSATMIACSKKDDSSSEKEAAQETVEPTEEASSEEDTSSEEEETEEPEETTAIEETPTPAPTETATTDPEVTTEEDAANDNSGKNKINQKGEDMYAGSYSDNVAGRSLITIVNDGKNSYSVDISWPNSAAEVYYWHFSGEFDGRGCLTYNNCTKRSVTYNEDGSIGEDKTEYSDGTGYIKMNDEGLSWSDDQDHTADDTSFIKVEEE